MSHGPAIRTLLCALLLGYASLSASSATGSSQKASSGAPAAKTRTVDVCALLTSAELQAAVGEPLAEARPSTQPAGRIQTSQCLFRTPTFAKSVSLTVALRGSGTSAYALREFWRNQFHPTPEKAGDMAGERAETPSASEAELEEDARKPRALSGLGDEAFWVGSPISGALYVLQGDAFLRVSVGGIPEESSRLAKSKMVARAAIARLRSMFPGNASRSPR